LTDVCKIKGEERGEGVTGEDGVREDDAP